MSWLFNPISSPGSTLPFLLLLLFHLSYLLDLAPVLASLVWLWPPPLWFFILNLGKYPRAAALSNTLPCSPSSWSFLACPPPHYTQFKVFCFLSLNTPWFAMRGAFNTVLSCQNLSYLHGFPSCGLWASGAVDNVPKTYDNENLVMTPDCEAPVRSQGKKHHWQEKVLAQELWG